MRQTINLATRRYINNRQLNLSLLIAFLVLGVFALYKVTEIATGQAELARLKGLSRELDNRVGGPHVSEAQLKAQDARIRFANEVIDRKAVNWLALLDKLERVVPPGLALTQIEPGKKQELKLSGAALNFASLRTLMENMERSKDFSEVYLLSQAENKVGLTQQGVFFSLGCKVALQ